jgi:hypothetical protein
MLAHLLVLAATAASVAPERDLATSPPAPPPRVHDLSAPETPPGIFTYKVDERCRVTQIRKLQGPDDLDWREVERQLQISGETIVWRMMDGNRRQLIERRVTLVGEMVQGGVLHCLLTPMGELIEAWIARLAPGAPRQALPRREPAPTRSGDLGDLGTFSVVVQPRQP